MNCYWVVCIDGWRKRHSMGSWSDMDKMLRLLNSEMYEGCWFEVRTITPEQTELIRGG